MIRVTISILLLIATASAQEWKTDKLGDCSQEDSNKIDVNFGKIFLFGELKIPIVYDIQSSNKWCNESRDGVKSIRETSKRCLTGLPKQVLNLVMFGINKGVKKNCKDEASKKVAYTNLGCLNAVESNMTQIMARATKNFRMVDFLPGDAKIPAICCSFYKFQADLSAVSATKCKSNSVDHLEDLINEFSGEAISLVCSSVARDSDTCKNHTFPPEIESKVDPTLASVTFIPSILNALTNL